MWNGDIPPPGTHSNTGGVPAVEYISMIAQHQHHPDEHTTTTTTTDSYSADAVSEYAKAISSGNLGSIINGGTDQPKTGTPTVSSPEAAVAAAALEATTKSAASASTTDKQPSSTTLGQPSSQKDDSTVKEQNTVSSTPTKAESSSKNGTSLTIGDEAPNVGSNDVEKKKATPSKAKKKDAPTPKKTSKTASSSSKTSSKTTKSGTPTKSRKKSAGSAGGSPSAKKKKSSSSSSRSASSKGGSATSQSAPTAMKNAPADGIYPTMNDHTDPISKVEYENLDKLMEEFCRVPLLAEFSRPVAILHPELMATYNKIVHHPIDLGRVCRRIRRRQYTYLREVRVDFWRIFVNCVRYHSHPHNKNAVPSFVSIALHLRDFFNGLWQEYMLPSDSPVLLNPTPGSSPTRGTGSKVGKDKLLRSAIEKRAKDRKARLVVAGLSVMAGNYLKRAGDSLKRLIDDGGRVDKLDTRSVWGDKIMFGDEDDADMKIVLRNLTDLHAKLQSLVAENGELGVDELETFVNNCYSENVAGLENMRSTLRLQIATRLDRYLGQLIVPIHEATCRGVSQSSIWGCMAAGVWARESSKKPFWPALVLGILAPTDQREAWHEALTVRNEERLPEKLKTQLVNGKRNAEKQIKRQSQGQAEPQSFFLIEFLGTHEFIWVREADIVENFNPEEDPNKNENTGANKKKRISRAHLSNILNSPTYANAIQEIQWALDEFEMQLMDIGGDAEEKPEGDTEQPITYEDLAVSDDEGGTDADDNIEDEVFDVDEANEMLATNGLLDLSAAGKKRRDQLKKQNKVKEEKKLKAQKARKDKAAKAKKEKEMKLKAKEKDKERKQNQRDTEKKRRKRIRDREKALQAREAALKEVAPGRRHTIANKRARAEAIVNGYLLRDQRESKHYKTLCLGKGANNIMTVPAALIDSSNLIGMALAFRAAAGDISMPEESAVHFTESFKDSMGSISLKGKKTSAERSAALKRQIEILEGEIGRSKASKKRRLELVKETSEAVKIVEEKMAAADAHSRVNPLGKTKRPPSSSGSRKRKKSPSIDAADSTNGKVVKKAATASSATTTTGTAATTPVGGGGGDGGSASAKTKNDAEDDLETVGTDSEAPDIDVPDTEAADVDGEADAVDDNKDEDEITVDADADAVGNGEVEGSNDDDNAMEVDEKSDSVAAD